MSERTQFFTINIIFNNGQSVKSKVPIFCLIQSTLEHQKHAKELCGLSFRFCEGKFYYSSYAFSVQNNKKEHNNHQCCIFKSTRKLFSSSPHSFIFFFHSFQSALKFFSYSACIFSTSTKSFLT